MEELYIPNDSQNPAFSAPTKFAMEVYEVVNCTKDNRKLFIQEKALVHSIHEHNVQLVLICPHPVRQVAYL